MWRSHDERPAKSAHNKGAVGRLIFIDPWGNGTSILIAKGTDLQDPELVHGLQPKTLRLSHPLHFLADHLVVVIEEVLVEVLDDRQILVDRCQQVYLLLLLLLAAMVLVLLLSLRELEARVEAGEGALSSAFPLAPIPCCVLSAAAGGVLVRNRLCTGATIVPLPLS